MVKLRIENNTIIDLKDSKIRKQKINKLMKSNVNSRKYFHQWENTWEGKVELQERRLRRRRPTTRWKKCNPVRKKKTQL